MLKPHNLTCSSKKQRKAIFQASWVMTARGSKEYADYNKRTSFSEQYPG
jgi:hypothetical protein